MLKMNMLKKIMNDSNYLETINSEKDFFFFLHLRNIFRKVKYAVFGNIFPSQNQPKDGEENHQNLKNKKKKNMILQDNIFHQDILVKNNQQKD